LRRKKNLLPALAEPEAELIPFQWEIAVGDKSAARPGMVMIRWSRAGQIMAEEHMPFDEFLNLAHGFENIARGIEADRAR
jgi:hypothetical protein